MMDIEQSASGFVAGVGQTDAGGDSFRTPPLRSRVTGAVLGGLALFLAAIRIAASDLAHATSLKLAAGIGHGWPGSVNWRLLASLGVGSLAGVHIGSHRAARAPEKVPRPIPSTIPVRVDGKRIAF